MSSSIQLRDSAWQYGSYPRKNYNRDVIYAFYHHRDVNVAGLAGRSIIVDDCAARLAKNGAIDKTAYDACMAAEVALFKDFVSLDPLSCEELYARFEDIRLTHLGVSALKADQEARMAEGVDISSLPIGIHEPQKKRALLTSSKPAYFALLEPEYLNLMKEDILLAVQNSANIVILTGDREGVGLPTVEMLSPYFEGVSNVTFALLPYGRSAFDLAKFESDVPEDATLFIYGEEGFLAAKNLNVNAFVQGVVRSYFAGAATGHMERERFSACFIPAHMNPTEYAPLIGKTRVTLRIMSLLRHDFGKVVDSLPLIELYRRYPQYFINIFSCQKDCPEAKEDYPIQMGALPGLSDFTEFDRLREEAVAKYLNNMDGLTYDYAWFDDQLQRKEIPWNAENAQDGILVHGIRAKKASLASVVAFPAPRSVRETMLETPSATRLQLLSNFLFFFTPRLAHLYNQLRAERKQEQLPNAGGHLDYMLTNENGARTESFPLYRKSLVAFKEDGRFLFCNFRLGAGRVNIGGHVLSWSAQDVDCVTDARPVIVYTPHLSRADEQADVFTYARPVGAGRCNFVIVQDKICFARMGDVILPSIGVVVSVRMNEGEALLRALGKTPDADGYCDMNGVSLSTRLDTPNGVSPEDWQKVKWAYGGGLTLILDGRFIYGEGDPTKDLSEEGWLSPLSRQTQESELHTLARHPRTAVGITNDGDLFILVFSGRTKLSRGADYVEMCRIARTLYPDVRSMMNVDGGGSSVLALAIDGHFMELSLPATSNGSCVGMVRPINTALCIGCE